MKKLLLFALAAGILSSCNYKSKAYKDLERRNDSLMNEYVQKEKNLNDYIDIVNGVEESFNKIKETEKYLSVNASGEKLDGNVRDRLTNDITLLQDILQKNKQQIDDLQKKAVHSQQLQQSLNQLKASIAEKEATIASLKEELEKKDVKIAELSTKIADLGKDVNLLENARRQNETQIAEQDSQLNTAWYIARPKKELKAAGLLEGGGLFSRKKVLEGDFDRSLFTAIDIRTTKHIEVASSNPKVLTKHPESSYTIEKGDTKSAIVISNPEFWRVSRYLVVQL